MFCNRCGAQLPAGATTCAACGTVQSLPTGSAVVPSAQDRVLRHHRTLGILWLVLAALTCIPIVVMLAIGAVSGAAISAAPDAPPIARLIGPALFVGIAAFVGVFTLGCFFAGWGLLKLRSWGRPVAIVMGILVLLNMPFGTALGIYTLWVLLSSGADQQYAALVHA
jgi:hypothetical protein